MSRTLSSYLSLIAWRASYSLAAMKRAATAIAADAPRSTVPRVAYLVYRVERRLRTRIDVAVSTVGVTTPEYVTLSVLRDRDGLSNAQLARWAFVTPQAMNLVISALERRGLVRRRPDPRHRRVLRTSVTPRGLELLDRCDREMDVIEADMLRDLDDDTLETVRSALSSCAQSLEATIPLPVPRSTGRGPRSDSKRTAAP